MKRYVWLATVLLPAVLMSAGCGAKAVYGPGDTAISAKAGETFTIELEENPTTGYQWSVTVSDETVVALDKDEYVPDDMSGDIAGSGGTRALTFKAIKAGGATIDMVNERSWEPSPDDEKLQFNVTVS